MSSTLRNLPRYWIVTVLGVMLTLVAAGGLIGYRVAINRLIDEVSAVDMAFVKENYGTVSAIADGEPPGAAFDEMLQTEQSRRTVVKVRVYNNQGRIMFSTDIKETGQYPSETTLNYWRGDLPSVRLTRYRTFDTGGVILMNRDILSTRIGLGRQGYFTRGSLEVYTDVTADQRRIVTACLLICGALSVVLITLPGVLGLLPRRSQ